MGLKLYYKDSNDAFVEISTGTDIASPVTTIHDGRLGDIVTKQLYLRNDDNSKWFSNISVTPLDTEDANPYGDIAYTETGWGVRLNKGSDEPSDSQWADIDWGEFILMDNVGSDSGFDISTYYPLWYYITCPPNVSAQVKTDIMLTVAYTENAVS